MKTANTSLTVLQNQPFSRKNRRRKNRIRQKTADYAEKLLKQCQEAICSITAALLTTTIFLGGSYLFFIQLAEYGW